MAVTLREVTRDNWQEAFALSVDEDQLRFIAEGTPPVAIALAKAYVRPSGLPAIPYGIYANERMIGFFNLVYEPGSAQNYWIFHFFIDRRFQRRGYGSAALAALTELIRQDHPACSAVQLTVHPDNVAAIQLYSKFGFQPTGETAFGEPVYRMIVRPKMEGRLMGQDNEKSTLRIGLAAVRNAPSVEERLQTLDRFLQEASVQRVAIVCFPETYIPGLRGMDFEVPPPDQRRQQAALDEICASACRHGVAVVVGMEWESSQGIHNFAFVIDSDGTVQGYQAKNQIPPQEEPYYTPEGRRRLFEVDGVPFGITICHEGWRFPETVRWSASRGAQLVFHPQLTGSDDEGPTLECWGAPSSPYYEKAMLARGVENSIYFASVNYAMRFQESATSLIGPDGDCLAYVPYGEERLLVYDIDLSQATGFYAKRFNPAFYPAS